MNTIKQFMWIAYSALFLTLSCFSASTATAQNVNWDLIDGKDITLFYPGQASWEWALTQSSHSGAKKFRKGKNCRGCHEGEQTDMGALILSGEKLDPSPFPYKDGSVIVNVKTSHDETHLYLRLEWPDIVPTSERVLDKDFEAKVAVMIDDGTLKESVRAGCWGACHDDANSMASSQDDTDLRKYLSRSRTKLSRKGGGLNFKSQADLDALAAQGSFLEYWQARLNKGAPAVAVGGFILKERQEHKTPIVNVTSHFEEGAPGKWVIEFSRKLAPAEGNHKTFTQGKTYTLGFALHGGHATQRFHYVSFEYTLVLDQGSADFVTLKQKP